MTTPAPKLPIDPEEDSELLCELYAVLENHGVDEGLRDTIMDMAARWEMEQPEGGPILTKTLSDGSAAQR